MRAKEFIEKRIRFENNGNYYCYSSSIPDKDLLSKKQYQQCETIFNGNVLKKEENSYVFYDFSQVDLKVIQNK